MWKEVEFQRKQIQDLLSEISVLQKSFQAGSTSIRKPEGAGGGGGGGGVGGGGLAEPPAGMIVVANRNAGARVPRDLSGAEFGLED